MTFSVSCIYPGNADGPMYSLHYADDVIVTAVSRPRGDHRIYWIPGLNINLAPSVTICDMAEI